MRFATAAACWVTPLPFHVQATPTSLSPSLRRRRPHFPNTRPCSLVTPFPHSGGRQTSLFSLIRPLGTLFCCCVPRATAPRHAGHSNSTCSSSSSIARHRTPTTRSRSRPEVPRTLWTSSTASRQTMSTRFPRKTGKRTRSLLLSFLLAPAYSPRLSTTQKRRGVTPHWLAMSLRSTDCRQR